MSSVSWSASPPPTSATPRADRDTYGGAVAETARLLGVPFMGWQSLTVDVAMEHVDGQLVHREVDLSIDRQAGKSTVIIAVAVHRMLSAPGSWLTYTSSSRLAARRKLLRVWAPLIARSPLRDKFSATKGTGTETLECSNGSVLMLLSGDEASGHGDSVDASFIDEAWSVDETAEAAVRPAMSTRRNAQLWVCSTAGTAKSRYWRAKVDGGRTAATLGVDDGSCFVEWAAGRDVDVTDPTTWPAFMPALGRTISEETVAKDLASMPLAQWKRAYCNLWDDETDAGWRVFNQADWLRATSGEGLTDADWE
jgi:phage terminase large subunit-like protein